MRRNNSQTTPQIWPRCCRRSPGRPPLDLLLSSESAKHLHWQTDPRYVRQYFRSGKGCPRKIAFLQSNKMEMGVVYALCAGVFWGTSPVLVKRGLVGADVSAA